MLELLTVKMEAGELDDGGKLVGHLCIRYPDEEDDSIVRFGFVIVDPALRGCGNGATCVSIVGRS